MMRIRFATCVALIIVASPVLVAAQDAVTTIVQKMKAVFEPAKPSTRKVVVAFDAQGTQVQWVARQARKEFPDGKRMVMVMMEPDDIKGNAYLVWEQKDQPAVMWIYSPALRIERKLLPVDAYTHFLGTDFTYADLGFVRMQPQYRLLGEEELGGKKAYKVEESASQERAYYSRVVTWVDSTTLLPLQREYYDVAGKLWKTESFEIATIDGVPTPVRIHMKDVQAGTSTELQVSEINYNVELPDSLFEPRQLPQAVASPLWGTTTTQGQ